MGPALRGAAGIQGGRRRPPLQGRTGAVRNGTSRTPPPTKSQGVCAMGAEASAHTRQSGTAGTACPTHSVIARSEATRQSVLPSPKRRIPTPVTRSLARNDSAPRWERWDTWVPPYGVRRSSRADRGVRPYEAEQEPCEAGRRGRRPLRWGTRTVRNGTAGTACPTNRHGAARTAKFRNFFFPLSASAGLRRLYSDDTGRPPVL